MPKQYNSMIVILVIISIVLVLGIVAMFVIKQADSSRTELPSLGRMSQFELTERSGASFGTKDMLGKINVVDFFFTSCMGPCPVMASNMGTLYNDLKDSDGIQFVSISVDPARDDLSVLRDYAVRQGVDDDRWVFLRGEVELIKEISEQGFKLAAEQLPAMHSTKFVLVDKAGNIRGYYSGTESASMNVLKTHIRELVNSNQ